FAEAVEQAVERQLKTLSRAETAARSWADFGGIVVVADLMAALPLANRIAAEHLELAVADPDAFIPGIRNAGAIFVGRYTP
ncbi:histidinol dehydrogenase, partial [Tritonibacter sp. SIMBA_163]|uniref:histidinol dehydrogenase n=1 Tax=Tritonibacter sp. SIMBA_163 TaxID=3080868 RepID=UPI0039817C0C